MKAYLGLFAIVIVGVSGVFAVSADYPQQQQEDWRAQVLRAQHVSICARSHERKQIVEDYIAGVVTLQEAATKFGELDNRDPENMTTLRVTLACDSQQQCLCRQVLMHVKATLEDRPEEAEQVTPRLESQWQNYLHEPVPGV